MTNKQRKGTADRNKIRSEDLIEKISWSDSEGREKTVSYENLDGFTPLDLELRGVEGIKISYWRLLSSDEVEAKPKSKRERQTLRKEGKRMKYAEDTSRSSRGSSSTMSGCGTISDQRSLSLAEDVASGTSVSSEFPSLGHLINSSDVTGDDEFQSPVIPIVAEKKRKVDERAEVPGLSSPSMRVGEGTEQNQVDEHSLPDLQFIRQKSVRAQSLGRVNSDRSEAAPSPGLADSSQWRSTPNLNEISSPKPESGRPKKKPGRPKREKKVTSPRSAPRDTRTMVSRQQLTPRRTPPHGLRNRSPSGTPSKTRGMKFSSEDKRRQFRNKRARKVHKENNLLQQRESRKKKAILHFLKKIQNSMKEDDSDEEESVSMSEMQNSSTCSTNSNTRKRKQRVPKEKRRDEWGTTREYRKQRKGEKQRKRQAAHHESLFQWKDSGTSDPGLTAANQAEKIRISAAKTKRQLFQIASCLTEIFNKKEETKHAHFRLKNLLEFNKRYKRHSEEPDLLAATIGQYRSRVIAQTVIKRGISETQKRCKLVKRCLEKLNEAGKKGELADESLLKKFNEYASGAVDNSMNVSADSGKSFQEELVETWSVTDMLQFLAKGVYAGDKRIRARRSPKKQGADTFARKDKEERYRGFDAMTIQRLIVTFDTKNDLRLIPEMKPSERDEFASTPENIERLVRRKYYWALSLKKRVLRNFFGIFKGLKADTEAISKKLATERKKKKKKLADAEINEIAVKELAGKRTHRNPATKKCAPDALQTSQRADFGSPLPSPVKTVIGDAHLGERQLFDDENESNFLTPLAERGSSWIDQNSRFSRGSNVKRSLILEDASQECSAEFSKENSPITIQVVIDRSGDSKCEQMDVDSTANELAAPSTREATSKCERQAQYFGILGKRHSSDNLSSEFSTPPKSPKMNGVLESPMEPQTPEGSFHQLGSSNFVSSTPLKRSKKEFHNESEAFKVPDPPSSNIGTPTEKIFIPCTEECDELMPELWGAKLYQQLRIMMRSCNDLMDYFQIVSELDSCPGCVPFQYPECSYGEECQDVIKLMRIVQLHSAGIRNFLRRMYYLRQIYNWLCQFDTILDSKDFGHLLKHIDLSDERRMDLSADRACIPSHLRETITKELKETKTRGTVEKDVYQKWEQQINAFNKGLEFPMEVCDICHQWRYIVQTFESGLTDDGDPVIAFDRLPFLNDTNGDFVKTVFQGRLEVMDRIKVCKNSKRFGFNCGSCMEWITKKNWIPPLAVENGMEIDHLPPEFDDLNDMEQMFIKQMSAFLMVVKLKTFSGSRNHGNQMYRALKGHGINLPLPLNEDIKLMSKTMPNLNFLTVLVDGVKTKENRKIWRSMVRLKKVLNCLRWFKKYNPHYADVRILDEDDPELQKMLDAVFREAPSDDDGSATEDVPSETGEAAVTENDNTANRIGTETNPEEILPETAGLVAPSTRDAPGTDWNPGSPSPSEELNNADGIGMEINSDEIMPETAGLVAPSTRDAAGTAGNSGSPSPLVESNNANGEATNNNGSVPVPSIRHVPDNERVEIELQQFSVTKLQVDQPSEKDTELYQKLKVSAEPVQDREPFKEQKIFPMEYPKGRNAAEEDPNNKRHTKVDVKQYLKGRFNNVNGQKFRRNSQFLFYHLNERNRKNINNGVYATMNMAQKPVGMNAKDFVEGVKSGKLENLVANMFGQIPGTKEYWNRRRRDLTNLQEKYGPPTFFLTLSCAEYLWPDMRKFLEHRNPDLRGQNINKLLRSDPTGVAEHFKRRLDAIFNKVILGKDKKGKICEGPLGKVAHFFWRIEYQARGAPHIHCFLWIEGAPILKEDLSNQEEVVQFIDKHITCFRPDEGDLENAELRRLVEQFQVHRCTSSCIRQGKTRRKRQYTFCRYHFPRNCKTETTIRSAEATVKSKMRSSQGKKLYELQRSDNEVSVNDYNPALLLTWKANMDVQYVGDESMVLVKYVTGYVAKHDKGNSAPVWNVIKRVPSLRSQLWKYGSDIFKNREMGELEAADRLLGHAMFKFSSGDRPQFLNTRPPNMRFRKVKKFEDAENLAKKDAGIDSLFSKRVEEDYYPLRPDSWEDINLMEVYSNWTYSPGKPGRSQRDVTKQPYPWRKKNLLNPDVEPDAMDLIGGTGESDEEAEEEGEALCAAIDEENEDVEPSSKAKTGSLYVMLRNGAGRFVQKRKTCPVGTSFYGCNTVDSQELQYRALLMLYKPWRSLEELKGEFESYKEAWLDYESNSEDACWKKDLQAREKVKEAKEKIERYQMEVAMEEEVRAEREKAGLMDEGANATIQEDDVPETADDPYRMSDEEVDAAIDSLNTDQKRVFDNILDGIDRREQFLFHREHCEKMKLSECSCSPDVKSNDIDPVRSLITGVGGTGKSHLIRVLSAELIRRYGKNGESVVVRMAPTGLASFNIEGRTIHKLFKIFPKITAKTQTLVLADVGKFTGLKDMQSMLANVKLFILDEYSMVSNLLLSLMNSRMNQVFPRTGNQGSDASQKVLTFGGRNLVLFGDILQLKPVASDFCYKPLSEKEINNAGGGIGIPQELMDQFSFDELLQNMRQDGDPVFQGMLERIRLGNLTEDDIELLKKQLINTSSPEETAQYLEKLMAENSSCLCLVAQEKEMNEINRAMLKIMGIDPILIPAWDANGLGPAKKVEKPKAKSMRQGCHRTQAIGKTAKSGGLPDMLEIGKDAKVMLRKNINEKEGLVNGAIGTVARIEECNGTVQKIYVRFDHNPGRIYPISRSRGEYEISDGFFVTRQQFPLCLSYAITIHRCQGVTLKSALINLGDDPGSGIFEDAMAYVALSRVKSLEQVHLISFGCHAIRANAAAVQEYSRLRESAGFPPITRYNDRPVGYRGKKTYATGTAEFIVKKTTQAKPKQQRKAGGADNHSQPNVNQTRRNFQAVLGICGWPCMRLKNQSNYCYANSLVQALLQLKKVQEMLQESVESHGADMYPAEVALLNLFQAAESGDGEQQRNTTTKHLSSTTELCRSVGMVPGDPDDVSQFWLELRANLSNSVSSLFQFEQVQTYVCSESVNGCLMAPITQSHDAFELQVRVTESPEVSFDTLITEQFEENVVPPNERTCNLCHSYILDRSSVRFPVNMKYLVVRLGLFNSQSQRMVRIIKDFNASDVVISGEHFEAVAMVEHHGQTVKKGHYQCWVRTIGDDHFGWAKLNDAAKPQQRVSFRQDLMDIAMLVLRRKELTSRQHGDN